MEGRNCNMELIKYLYFLILLTGVYGTICPQEECKKDMEMLMNNKTFYCNNQDEAEQIILKCIRKSHNEVCETETRLALLPVWQNFTVKYYDDCPAAQAGKNDDCNLGTLIGCLGYFATALQAPNFPLDNMDKFCDDLKTLLNRVDTCAFCAGTLYIKDWSVMQSDVRKIVDVIKSLLNGGCECAKKLNLEVGNIDPNETCSEVKAARAAVQKIADECIIPEINKQTSFNFGFLANSLVDSAISISHTICLLFGAASPSAVSSVTFIFGGATLALILGLNSFSF